MNMDDREYPVFIETAWIGLPKRRFAKITSVQQRTRCTRIYIVTFVNGETQRLKGAASRPRWIRHIFRSEEEWKEAMDVKIPVCPVHKMDMQLYGGSQWPSFYKCPKCNITEKDIPANTPKTPDVQHCQENSPAKTET